LPLDEELAFEVDRTCEGMATPDRVEGMQTFVEKHVSVFTGEEPRLARAKKSKAKPWSQVGASKSELCARCPIARQQ
jgi:hypothetical protein